MNLFPHRLNLFMRYFRYCVDILTAFFLLTSMKEIETNNDNMKHYSEKVVSFDD